MGRKRKPFIEKSSSFIINIQNSKAIEMLKIMGYEIETPELLFESEDMKKLSGQIMTLIDKHIEDHKRNNCT